MAPLMPPQGEVSLHNSGQNPFSTASNSVSLDTGRKNNSKR
jgi:hypothetical protein